ncbi:hypothetical protein K1719_036540 [Acacia pycnantha]|nr:hypothetical protein K1719_036540 [Acacia pycnantha]
MPDGTTRISVGGRKAYHVFSCSTCFTSCGFSNDFGASWETAQVQSGSFVVVFGLGAVGLGGKGKAIAVGAGTEKIVQVNWLGILLERTSKGSSFGGLKTQSDLSIIATKCQNKDFPLHELFTHEVPLTNK